MNPVLFDPSVFSLGIAMGVLGLIFLLSLIIAYAYAERTLWALAAYLSLTGGVVAASPALDAAHEALPAILLTAGPLLVVALQAWLMRVRQTSRRVAFSAAALVLSTVVLWAGLLSGYAVLSAWAAAFWALTLVTLSALLIWQSWDSVGPWKWWLLIGHSAGLLAAWLLLSGLVAAPHDGQAMILMLFLQIPPIYLALVWRSRLLNESRLRSFSASTTDPLTGLATTAVLIERLMRMTARAPVGGTRNALFVIEVHNWQEQINLLGADYQEKLLLEVAMRLRRAMGDKDLGVRLPNERFAVVAQGLQGEADINALATRLVVSGLRIDSPLLAGLEFQFRIVVVPLLLSQPLTPLATQAWLQSITLFLKNWPSSHRTRSIFMLSEAQVKQIDSTEQV